MRCRSGSSSRYRRSALRGVPRLAGPVGDAVARPQRVGVIRSEDALPVREQLAVQTQRLARVPRLAGPVGDAVARPQRVGVIRSEDALPVREQLAVQTQRLARPPPRRSSGRSGGASPACRGDQVRGCAAGPGAARGTDAAPRASPRLAGPVGDLVARPQRVGVIRSEDALPVREQLAVQTQRLVRVPRLAGPVGDAVARPQRVGVIRFEGALASPGAAPRYRRSASRASPAAPVQWAIWWRVPSVSG